MKKALFELQTIVNPWRPPFKPTIECKGLEAGEGESFDLMEKCGGNVKPKASKKRGEGEMSTIKLLEIGHSYFYPA